jgi:hypothetical protein
MRYRVTNEAHRLPKHEDYILVDDSARRGKEEPGDGDVEDRDGANERVRPDETHLGLMFAGMCMYGFNGLLRCLRSSCCAPRLWDPDCLFGTLVGLIGDCACLRLTCSLKRRGMRTK